jgi:hypothetical protein
VFAAILPMIAGRSTSFTESLRSAMHTSLPTAVPISSSQDLHGLIVDGEPTERA